MYLKFIGIKNIGAIEKLKIEPSFTDEGNPKPIIIVGENGTGKTILLSNIVDSFYEIAGELFENVAKHENTGRHFFKIKGNPNLRVGEKSGFVAIQYQSSALNKNLEYIDCINATSQEVLKLKNDFKLFEKVGNPHSGCYNSLNQEMLNYALEHYSFLPPLITKEERELLKKEWYHEAHYYQPAYRYEEPFWKNPIFYERFEDSKKFNNHYYKDIEELTSMDKTRSFIMDIVLDGELAQNKQGNDDNRDTAMWNGINSILRMIKKDPKIRFGISSRTSGARVGIARESLKGESEPYLPNISYLSLGESILLNFFVNILRHTDLSNQHPTDVRGIVVIDEVDTHLHSNLQSEVLPKLIKLFPKIQFILTTHSPLFVLGMQREFGDNGFDLIEMPTGEKITAERFREFEKAYELLTETKKFEDDLRKQVENSHKPLVFVEGEYDIRYIKHICKLFKREDILNQIQLCDGGGYKKLNNIWNLKSNLFQNIKNKTLLLYDCDTEVGDGEKENLVRRIIPPLENALFDKGIENRFSEETIQKIRANNPHFIDFTSKIKKEVRGEEFIEPEKYEINKDEKGNLCDWICKNGTKEDFRNFEIIIQILGNFLKDVITQEKGVNNATN